MKISKDSIDAINREIADATNKKNVLIQQLAVAQDNLDVCQKNKDAIQAQIDYLDLTIANLSADIK